MIEAILNHWMIESSVDFWIFISIFSACAAVILGAVWMIIYKKRGK